MKYFGHAPDMIWTSLGGRMSGTCHSIILGMEQKILKNAVHNAILEGLQATARYVPNAQNIYFISRAGLHKFRFLAPYFFKASPLSSP
jgi:hypothetical protein